MNKQGIHLGIVNDGAEREPDKEAQDNADWFNEIIAPVRRTTIGRSMAIVDGVNIDALVFDYGGAAMGYAPNPIYDEMAMAVKWAEEHPGKPLIIWSSYQKMLYEQVFRDEIRHRPNNMLWLFGGDIDVEIQIIQQWLGQEVASE